jgi:hypothetical protein
MMDGRRARLRPSYAAAKDQTGVFSLGMFQVAMSRNKRHLFWALFWLFLGAAFWALDIEVTFEHNVRQNIPADFELHRSQAVVNWRV